MLLISLSASTLEMHTIEVAKHGGGIKTSVLFMCNHSRQATTSVSFSEKLVLFVLSVVARH